MYLLMQFRVHDLCSRFGLMHLVATNIVLWIRTLLKEFLHEISEAASVEENAKLLVISKSSYYLAKLPMLDNFFTLISIAGLRSSSLSRRGNV